MYSVFFFDFGWMISTWRILFYTKNPIEKYVGWADMSSYLIFKISGLCPQTHRNLQWNFENPVNRSFNMDWDSIGFFLNRVLAAPAANKLLNGI